MDTTFTEEEMAEFDSVFGLNDSEVKEESETNQEDETEKDTVTEETDNKDSENESEETEKDKTEQKETDDSEKQKSSKNHRSEQSKQNHAWAQLRTQNKEQERLIKRLGKLIGLDENTKHEDIVAGIEDRLYQKEAEQSNVPVDVLKRMSQLEQAVQISEQEKQRNNTFEAFSALIDKYELDQESTNAFTAQLLEQGLNPLEDSSVDIEAEFLKVHHQDIVDKAVEAALEKERGRKQDIKEHAADPVQSKHSDGDKSSDSDYSINSVSELDRVLKDMG